jgi:hypothetical protein
MDGRHREREVALRNRDGLQARRAIVADALAIRTSKDHLAVRRSEDHATHEAAAFPGDP